MSVSTLKSLLAKFLKGEVLGKYPEVEATILSLNPLQITDDFLTFIDLSSLEDSVVEELGEVTVLQHKLVLQDWKYVLRRIPNSHEYYFDLNVNRYKLLEDSTPHTSESDPIKMEDDKEIKYHFEHRKRSEIEKMVRGVKEAPSRGEGSKKSPAKTTLTKEDTVMSTKPSHTKIQIPDATEIEFQRTVQKASLAKTEVQARETPYYDSSFFRKAGIVSAKTKISIEDSLLLTIIDIMSVPAFVPQAKRSVIRPVPLIRLRRSNSSESNFEEIQRESISRMVQRYSTESTRGKDMVDFEELHEHIRAGKVKWSQIVFHKSALEHLQKHRHLLEQATE